MTTSIKYLRMYMHGLGNDGLPLRQPVGYLSQYGDIMRLSFDAEYVSDSKRPIVSLAYQGGDEADTRAILEAKTDVRLVRQDGHWPSYFMNLLPEGHNRVRLARERGCREEDDFELLAAAGHDLMGAIEVEPVSRDQEIPHAIRHWHTALGLDVLEPGFVEEPVADGAAIPGVVDKFSAIKEGRRYTAKRHGAAGSYILKLPSTRQLDLVENEYMGYQLCKAVGLACAEAEIIPREDADLPEHVDFPRILAVKRFDRDAVMVDGEQSWRRIHFEEFCQAFGYEPRQKYGVGMATDYSRIAALLNAVSGDAIYDLSEFVRRFTAFVLMGNCDAHLKNWGLVYRDGRTPRLAPLYDPVCVAAYFDDNDRNLYAYNRAIDDKLRALTVDGLMEIMAMAKLNTRRLGQMRRQIEHTIATAKRLWPELLKSAPPSMRDTVMVRLNGGTAMTAAS
jgi:serine/threonine-protein kinase HipA